MSGQRNLNNNFVVDGLSANDDAADLAGMYLSQEVVREFEVVTSGGGAEFGRASSGTISVVTQSGTNRNGGRAYEFFRNDRFDAQNPLATRKDPLNQNQFGLTFGGPIVRDRTFWFGNVERTQQDRTGIVTIAPASVTAVNAALDAAGYRGPRIATGNFRDRLHRHQRVRSRRSSGGVRPAAAGALQRLQRDERQRAQRRRPQRRQPRRGARRHRSDRGRQLPDDAARRG